jgi:hypothetical protein
VPLFSKNAGAGAPGCKLQLWFRHNVRDQELPTSDFSVIVSFSFVSLNFFFLILSIFCCRRKKKICENIMDSFVHVYLLGGGVYGEGPL